jgi:membrane-associated phospholipid phosphatase
VRALRPLSTALLLATGLAPAAPGRADEAAALRRDTWRAAGITVGALAITEVLAATWESTDCRICGSSSLDEHARDALRWSDTKPALDASNVLAKLAIPVLAGVDAWRSTRSWGNTGRDVLVVAEAFSLTGLATAVAKGGFARLRPGLPDEPGQSSGAYHSLWSSHTSVAFSIAVAQAMQDTLRDDPAAPWVWGIGLTLAGAVGYFRVAGDAHWLTDVLAGAAVGTAFGVGVPLLEQRLVRGVTLAPAPGGVALRW